MTKNQCPINHSIITECVLRKYEENEYYKELKLFFNPMGFHIHSNVKTYMHFFICNIEQFYKNKLLYPNLNHILPFVEELLVDIYTKILKTYNGFRKLVKVYRTSKYETIIDTDLLLNTIKEKDKNIICIVQNKKKYLFYIFELSKIIYNSLSNSTFFFSEPLEIKNPYNNIVFEYHDLCNIYFFMKFRCILFNELFEKYFKCNFIRKIFLHRNFNVLRESSISNYVYNKDKHYLCIEITNMINNYNNRISKKYRILIHDDFPMEILYSIMKKYIHLYISAWYSFVEYESNAFGMELNHRLFYFQKYNPNFGRLCYKFTRKFCPIKRRTVIGKERMFNTKHIHFMEDLNMRFDGHYKYLKLMRFYTLNRNEFLVDEDYDKEYEINFETFNLDDDTDNENDIDDDENDIDDDDDI